MTLTADARLRARVLACMEEARLSQAKVAKTLGKSQSWLSRRLNGVQMFRMHDLDKLSALFQLSVPELFFDSYGQWDRRSRQDRRQHERRQRQQTIYDPTLEPTAKIAAHAFPSKDRHH